MLSKRLLELSGRVFECPLVDLATGAFIEEAQWGELVALRVWCSSKHRWLWELVMNGGCVFTLGLEIGFPFLVWNRKLRWLMITGAVLLHTGIALIMGLIGFGLCMLCLLLAFVPPEAVHRLLDALDPLVRRQLDALGFRPSRPAGKLALGH